ncbi:MAG: RHS repeat-associated core domain-containing protein [Gammaproteobacteria bacterium]|nr:RHS repeat-associated core domain-containing protein [Gammaproteobacteria bacterium]
MERQSMRTTRLPGSWLPGVVRYLLLSWLAFWGLSGPAFGDTQVYYIHTDHLGTPQVITDQNQEVAWQADYEPFGEATVTTAVIENPLRLPGQYFDAETGLHYNYFRDYDPGTGRYLESDPIGLSGGLNTYLYAEANPVRFVDPYGEEAVLPFPGGAAGAGAAGKGLGLAGAVTSGAAVAGAGLAGYGIGSLIYPYIAEPLGDVIDAVCRDDPTAKECEDEWRKARQRCRELIYEELEQRAGRRKKRSVRGVTGGYSDVEECARGLVSEACGGNRVER